LVHVLALTSVLFGLWLLLSGHYTPLFFFLGALSTAIATFFAHRMDVFDDEGVPVVHLTRKIWTYIPWLIWEVARSNLAVARIVLRPTLRISPTVVKFRARQQTDLGRVIMANSVTMTPGTITVAVTGSELHVHALYRQAVDGIEEGEMNRRVAELERHRA
jgi:multicomponent Na+:H+ antiporter subunit E